MWPCFGDRFEANEAKKEAEKWMHGDSAPSKSNESETEKHVSQRLEQLDAWRLCHEITHRDRARGFM